MTEELWQVRVWDMMDGTWIDVGDPMPRQQAECYAGDRNAEAHDGNRHAGYDDGDYYDAFPADSELHWSNGREMFR